MKRFAIFAALMVGCSSSDKVGSDLGEADGGDMAQDSSSLCAQLQEEFEELTAVRSDCEAPADCVLVPGRTEDRPDAQRGWPDRAFEVRDQGVDKRCEYFQAITNNDSAIPPGFRADCVDNQCVAVERN